MDLTIRITPKGIYRLFVCLLAFELLLTLAFIVESVIGSPAWLIERLLDLDGEDSVATWFSVIQLSMVGTLFGLLWAQWRRSAVPRWFLGLAALGFLFMSMDEALMLHESVTLALEKLSWMPRFSGDHGIWIFVYLPVGVAGLLVALRPLAIMWRRHRHALLVMAAGALAFLTGAVGLEIIGYEFLVPGTVLYAVEVAAEELLEMMGISTILCGALFYVIEVQAARRRMATPQGAAAAARVLQAA